MSTRTNSIVPVEIRSETHNMIYRKYSALDDARNSQLFSELSYEDRNDLFGYLVHLGISDTHGLLVIPSNRHYFYNADDLAGVKTILYLRQLNHVRDINGFMQNLFTMLPNGSKFVGFFIDNKAQGAFSDRYNNRTGNPSGKSDAYENGIESRIPFINRLYSLIDFRTNSYLTRRTVSNLIQGCGLQLLSVTDLNGLTYFCSQKIRSVA